MTRPGRWLDSLVAVAGRELRTAYGSAVAWVFLVSQLVFVGLFLVASLQTTGEAGLRPVVPNVATALLFCLPLLTMGQLAAEERRGSLELLLTAPVPLSAVVLGKWGAVVAQCAVWLMLCLPAVAVLFRFGEPDAAAVAGALIGLALCCAAFAAVGLFTSSLTREPMVAGVGAVLLLLPSWLASSLAEQAPAAWAPWLARLSFVEHLRALTRGTVHSGDLAWFAGVCALFLFLTWRSLESRRWR